MHRAILGNLGASSRDDVIFSLGTEVFEFRATDWLENCFFLANQQHGIRTLLGLVRQE